MRSGRGVLVGAELRLRQHRKGLTTEIVEQPRLADQQLPRVLVAARVNFGLGAFDDQECVGIGVAPRGGQQSLRRVPGTARQAQRIGPVRGGVIGGGRDRGLAPALRRQHQVPRQRRDPESAVSVHLPACLTRVRTR